MTARTDGDGAVAVEMENGFDWSGDSREMWESCDEGEHCNEEDARTDGRRMLHHPSYTVAICILYGDLQRESKLRFGSFVVFSS